MKFINHYGTTIEVLKEDSKYVTFKINIENKIHTDIDCWTTESFYKMIKENNYKIM